MHQRSAAPSPEPVTLSQSESLEYDITSPDNYLPPKETQYLNGVAYVEHDQLNRILPYIPFEETHISQYTRAPQYATYPPHPPQTFQFDPHTFEYSLPGIHYRPIAYNLNGDLLSVTYAGFL
jgi:hypothetical protein